MEFNRDFGPGYTAEVERGAGENTLIFEIKQKDVTASDLNSHIVAFAEENGINEVDANTMQLITEELIVAVLLERIPGGKSLQYYISHNGINGIIKIGMGYPGERYNPFEDEDDIFMINVFREWITKIEFKNPDNSFNELLCIIQGEKAEAPSDISAPVSRNPAGKKEEKVHGDDKLRLKGERDKAVPEGTVVQEFLQSARESQEILIRDPNMDADKLYRCLEPLFEKTDLDKRMVVFEGSIPHAAKEALKSICKVIVFNVLANCKTNFSYIFLKIDYEKNGDEIMIRMRFPGDAFNPVSTKLEDKKVNVINRQTTIIPFYTYKNRINEVMMILTLEE